jgi:uncharacterized protein YfaP (DUF2135 family)
MGKISWSSWCLTILQVIFLMVPLSAESISLKNPFNSWFFSKVPNSDKQLLVRYE